jgi:PAS domain S-box-containing protein
MIRDRSRLFESDGIAVAVANSNGDVIDANPAFLRMVGYEPADLDANGLSLAGVFPVESAADLVRAISMAARGRPAAPLQTECTRKDGSHRTVICGVTDANAAEASLYFVDVTSLAHPRGAHSISDLRLRQLFDANIMGILIANNAGSIIQANDAFLDIIGYSRDDLDRHLVDWRKLTPHEWLHLDERAIAEMEERGSFAQYEKEYVRKDGTRVPISLGGARITGTNDEQICYVVDLSAIRRAEAALRRSESRFKELSDANVIGVMTSRLSDNVITQANDEFLRMIGYSREEFRQSRLSWLEMTPPQWREAGERAREELLQFGRFSAYEKEYYRKDGSRLAVLIGGALLAESGNDIISYALDLSERQAATLRVQESERRYRILAEALPQIVMLADEARQPIYVNRHYEKYTGLTLADLPTKWLEVIHPDDLGAVEKARSTGLPYEVQYRLRRASDGSYRWHFARVMKIAGHTGNEEWLATAMDIDDRKRAEDSLRFIERAASLLSQSLDLQATFETLLDLVVPDIADWAAISLRDEDGSIKTVVARHRDPAKAGLAQALCGVDFCKDSYTAGTAAVYRTGATQLCSQLGPDDIAAAIKEAYAPTVRELGYGSLIALPLFSGGEVAGCFGIVRAVDERRFTEADLPPLEELARRASFSIENARRYQREHRVADSLQRAALPRTLPTLAGFGFDAYYQAGRREAAIGGDWFDAFVTPRRQLVVSVGDVAGSGLEAAVLMGNLRQIIRTAANVYADPTTLLDVADSTLRSEHGNSMATVFVGVIDPASRTMTYGSAGHLPALLRMPDDEVIELRAGGLPLGCRDLAPGQNQTIALGPGCCLLLFTDGLVEWSRDLSAGLATLREKFAAADCRGQSAKALVESILPATGARDDIAALMVAIE